MIRIFYPYRGIRVTSGDVLLQEGNKVAGDLAPGKTSSVLNIKKHPES